MPKIKYKVQKVSIGIMQLKLTIAAITEIDGIKFESDAQYMNDHQMSNFLREHCTKEALIELLKYNKTTGHYGLYFIEG